MLESGRGQCLEGKDGWGVGVRMGQRLRRDEMSVMDILYLYLFVYAEGDFRERWRDRGVVQLRLTRGSILGIDLLVFRHRVCLCESAEML